MAQLLDMGIALFAVMGIMLVSEVLSLLTKGKIPQMFLMALFFMVGFWVGLPKDIIQRSNLIGISDIARCIILIHIATVFDFKALAREWRVVVTSLAAMVGILIIVYGVCFVFYTPEYATATVPPLMGGMAAAYLMLEGSPNQTITLLILLTWILQAFIGYPAASFLIRKEGTRLYKNFQTDPVAARKALGIAPVEAKSEKVLLIDKLPSIVKSPTFIITEMLCLAAIAAGLSVVCGMIFNISLDLSPVFSIVVGVAARTLGLIDKSPLDKANSSGIMFIALYASMMADFSECTPAQVFSLLGPTAVILAAATIGILLVSIPVGKKLGYSSALAAALGMNCYLGFPVNYAITKEQIDLLTTDEEARAFLNDALMSKMIIAGITSVTIVSCVVASIFMTML